ncbi:uncharacterized protein LOC128677812 isoform X2 [Plodia interpunctella]|uniref:uncharacterized protein LOC128677812 isoform X2 n=1 Tax=Plodia interpunctella TaxID=58824 RepID=UPI00236809A8|nr:uncharacterized protein LOC128677812 isoform X2 [Plodia interpunctella]
MRKNPYICNEIQACACAPGSSLSLDKMAGQDHEAILRNLLDSIAEQLGYEDHQLTVTPIHTAGANYTSKLFRTTISGKDKEDLKVFGKVALMGVTLRSQVRIRLFETEQFFYNELANIYENIQETHGLATEHKLFFPKFYGYNDTELQETIVLEDLSARGFSCYSRFEAIDWPYAAKAVEEMAKLHALSMAFAKENPEQFERLMGNYRFDPKENKNAVECYWKKMLSSAINACTEDNARLLESHYGDMDDSAFVKMRQTLRRPILVHSDFRPSNLMHKIRKDGSLEMIVIDYQLLQAGCPVYDLLFFIMSGSDAAFRRDHQDRLREHYYEHLRRAMQRLELDPDEEYSRADFDYEWNEMLPNALTMAVFSLPIITVDEEDAPVIDHNTDMNGFAIMRTSELFSKRMNEIVSRLPQMGHFDSRMMNGY